MDGPRAVCATRSPGGAVLSLAGRLLVATPALFDPHFFRTVVLIVEDDAEGTMGVILNRSTGLTASDDLPFIEHVAEPATVFSGGPVQPEHGLALAAGGGPFSIEAELSDGAVGIVAPDTESIDRIRYFAGYAGWVPGQLQAELDEEAWWVIDASMADLFTVAPDQLWRAVLRRQPGRLSMLASYPEDPSLN